MLKHRLNQILFYTRKERNGVIVLLLLCLLLLIARFFVLFETENKPLFEDEAFSSEIENFEKKLKLKEVKTLPIKGKNLIVEEWVKPEVIFKFDPNMSDVEEFKKLGFTNKQISTLMNYRNKGGKFIDKKDLLKIYGITKEQFDIIEPYIEIKSNHNPVSISISKIEKPKPIKMIEINSASESELTELNGIGEAFAKRIFKYRETLGGFYLKEQLFEVYGMDTTRYNMFIHQVIVDTILIHKVDINSAKYSELIKKQYMNKFQVQAILKYRELKGKFVSLDELLSNNLLPENVYVKMKPYLVLK